MMTAKVLLKKPCIPGSLKTTGMGAWAAPQSRLEPRGTGSERGL